MARRGFTLLELLLAVGLLLAIAAIAAPVVVTSLGPGAHDATVEITKAALLHARAHAQATGRPVEVVYASEPPHLEARAFDPTTGGLDDDDPAALLAEGWAYRPLPSGVRLTRQPPADEGDGAVSLDFAPPEQFADPADEEMSLRLAVYLPDGSAMLAEPVWIVADDGERSRLVVNPWSGLPRLAAPESPDQEEDEPAVDEEEDDDEGDPRDDDPGPASDPGFGGGGARSGAGDPASGEGDPDER